MKDLTVAVKYPYNGDNVDLKSPEMIERLVLADHPLHFEVSYANKATHDKHSMRAIQIDSKRMPIEDADEIIRTFYGQTFNMSMPAGIWSISVSRVQSQKSI